MAPSKPSHQNNHPNIIEVRGISFSRGDRVIFDNINLDIHRGKITAIMGPSGTGKTTLLRLTTALLYPDSGTIHVNGENVHRLSHDGLYQMRRGIGMLFQSSALFTDMSVYDNVAFPLREHTNLPDTIIRDIVLMKLEAVGLRGAIALMPRELSGGMARRVALARSIALDPEIIFYDEPFSGQDPISMGVLVKLIQLLNQVLGLTSVIVSHDVAETAAIADYIYLLAHGRVIAADTPAKLSVSEQPEVQQFMQGKSDGPVPFHYPAPNYVDELMREA